MGIFNFTITIPQIVMGLVGGSVVSLVKNSILSGRGYETMSAVEKVTVDSQAAAWMIGIAAAFMLIAAISVFFVKEKRIEQQ